MPPLAPAPVRQHRIPGGDRIYAIGDVHGRLDLLERLIGLIRQDSVRREPARVWLILLGDIVDRGPSSAEIVRRCMLFTGRTDRFIVLKGNHEAMMADSLAGNYLAFSLWLRSGGDSTLLSWGVAEDLVMGGPTPDLLRAARSCVSAQVLDWLKRLPLIHHVGDYLFVHAGIRPEVVLSQQTEADLLWIRQEFLESTADHSFVVVHGHSISEDAIVERPNRIGIDTGAYRTNVLSAVGLEANSRWTLATDKFIG